MGNNPSILKGCKSCNNGFKGIKERKRVSFFSSFLLAFLPKCPFCFMAFTNTLILCGESGSLSCQRTFTSSTTSLLTILFCSIILLSIILNYRDRRTLYAIALVVMGSVFLMISVAKTGGLPLYYFGVVFIFSGVWLNASLLFFIRKIGEFMNFRNANQLLKNG
jgi:hypothetical protein